MPPVIAIVGRPNVGKSTLFNRLTARRPALVSDTPGVTRDRREGERRWRATITIVDTAGLEEAAPGAIPARMRSQADRQGKPISCCSCSTRARVMPSDRAFATAAPSRRPIRLVANKSEGRAGADGFLRGVPAWPRRAGRDLGEHGEGIGELAATTLAAAA